MQRIQMLVPIKRTTTATNRATTTTIKTTIVHLTVHHPMTSTQKTGESGRHHDRQQISHRVREDGATEAEEVEAEEIKTIAHTKTMGGRMVTRPTNSSNRMLHHK